MDNVYRPTVESGTLKRLIALIVKKPEPIAPMVIMTLVMINLQKL
jgi:hypothetical protein